MLADEGIVVPSRRFGRWFKNWQDEIKQEYLERGERVIWESIGKGPQTEYALAVQIDPEPKGLVTPKPSSAPGALPPQPVWRPKVHKPLEVTDRHRQFALELVADAKPNVKAKVLVESLAEEFKITPGDARSVFNDQVVSGCLYKRLDEGSLFYSTEPAEPKKPTGQLSGRKEADTPREPLTLADKKAIRLMLRAMTGRWAYVTSPLTAREILNQIDTVDPDHTPLSEDDVRNYATELQKVGVFTKVQAREGRKRQKAKRLEVQKIGIANQDVMKALRKTDGISNAIRAVDTGNVFTVEEPSK